MYGIGKNVRRLFDMCFRSNLLEMHTLHFGSRVETVESSDLRLVLTTA